MWHEARKQERLIRGMIVDYRRRAERRQDFYEKIQADPTQFLQLHGRRCKIHLDPALAAAGDGSAIIVPWQGQQDNLIDRFDVRAHLDYIPAVEKLADVEANEISQEERQCNYERYRILAQNDFLNLPEEKFLNQLYLEEQFGANAQLEAERNASKKKPLKCGAQIGYSYDDADSLTGPQPFSHLMNQPSITTPTSTTTNKPEKEGESDSESDIDMDVSIDVTKLDTTQAHELNAFGRNYGMVSNDFYSYLTKDADEADAIRLAREEEQEKMLLSGRRSRRERRAQKERRIAFRPLSPPSYAAKDDAQNKNKDESESRSPSPTDPNTDKITYITSFGGEDELQPHTKISINFGKGGQTLGESCLNATTAHEQPTYAQKVKENLEKLKAQNMAEKRTKRPDRSRSRTKSKSRDRSRRRRTYTRSRSRSYDRRYKYRSRRSRSSTRERSSRLKRYRRSKSRSKSRSRNTRRRRYSTSLSDDSKKRSRSRSRTKRSPYAIRTKIEKKMLPSKPFTTVSITTVANTAPTTTIAATTTAAVTSVTTVPSFLFPSISRPIVTPQVACVKPNTAISEESIVQPPTPPLKRYYGRKRANESSSESGSNSEAEDSNIETKWTAPEESKEVDTTSPTRTTTSTSAYLGKQTGKNTSIQAKNSSLSNTTETKGMSGISARLNLRDRLKKKMQNLLNKQYKADKRAEIEKTERDRLMQQEREDEMRELALRLRRRQRELRHKYGTPTSSKSSDSEETDDGKSKSRQRSNSANGGRRSKSPIAKTVTESRSRERRDERSKRSPSQRRSSSRKHRSKSRCSSTGRRRQKDSPRGQHHHEKSYEHSASSRSHRSSHYSRSDDYSRRSSSRRRDADNRGRDRIRERERDRERDRNRDYERDRDRRRSRRRESPERDRNRRDRDYGQRNRETSDRHATSTTSVSRHTTTSTSFASNRNAVVISAPPKLKKLVDY